jgi:hypothetical protein
MLMKYLFSNVNAALPAALIIFHLLAGSSPASAAPPAGQTYFTVLLGFSKPYEWEDA